MTISAAGPFTSTMSGKGVAYSGGRLQKTEGARISGSPGFAVAPAGE